MHKWIFWMVISIIIIISAIALAGAVLYIFANFFVNFWWFSSLDLSSYFWLRPLYRYGILIVMTTFLLGIFYLNFKIALADKPSDETPDKPSDKSPDKPQERLKPRFLKFWIFISFLLSLPVVIPVFKHWDKALLFIFGTSADPAIFKPDPIFGKNISYYLLSMPFYDLIHTGLLASVIILIILIFAIYRSRNRITKPDSTKIKPGSRANVRQKPRVKDRPPVRRKARPESRMEDRPPVKRKARPESRVEDRPPVRRRTRPESHMKDRPTSRSRVRPPASRLKEKPRSQVTALPQSAKNHICILIFIAAVIQIWGYVLARHKLVFTNTHLPDFFGPGYIDMHYHLPMIWAMIILFAASAISLIVKIQSQKGDRVFIGFAFAFIGIWGLSNVSAIPDKIEDTFFKSNEIANESPYIGKSIASVLSAYDIENVDTREYVIDNADDLSESPDIDNILQNVPVWERQQLYRLFNQLQGLKRYYSFPDVDVDRYNVDGMKRQVYLAARELDIKSHEEGKIWVNTHLHYTHGYGLTMVSASQDKTGEMIWYIKNISQNPRKGLEVLTPAIYYGEEDYDYAIAPNNGGEIDHLQDSISNTEGKTANSAAYKGRGGILCQNFFKRMIFSIFFRKGWIPSTRILLSKDFTDETRFLIRRNIKERILAITPFLKLDEDPYIVLSKNGGLFWIQDAYTMSGRFPGAEYYNADNNYIRNSIKIVVDAYNGSVKYYLSDPHDPVAKTLQRIYPGLIAELSDIEPQDLKEHMRYPKKLFEIQMRMYAKYHQTNPEDFFRGKDKWEMAKLKGKNVKPYYMTLNLLDPELREFLLLSPMSPKEKNNLSALALARCDGDNYGQIVVYNFPKESLAYGPSQISDRFDSDKLLTKELSLWSKKQNSKVIRSRMIIIPVAGTIFYIQPVYLSSTTDTGFPELKQLFVSRNGESVAMANNITDAVKILVAGISSNEKKEEESTPPPMTDGSAGDEVSPKSEDNTASPQPYEQPKADPEKTQGSSSS